MLPPDKERPLEVRIEYPVPHRFVNLQKRHAAVRPGVADDDGERAERRRFLHHPVHLRGVHNVRLDNVGAPPHAANFLGDLLCLHFPCPVVNDHVRAFPREAERDCLPDAA